MLIARTSRDGRRGDGNVRDATAVDAEDDVPTRRPNARETAVNVAIVDADVIAVLRSLARVRVGVDRRESSSGAEGRSRI